MLRSFFPFSSLFVFLLLIYIVLCSVVLYRRKIQTHKIYDFLGIGQDIHASYSSIKKMHIGFKD
jgi:hypothetical protein